MNKDIQRIKSKLQKEAVMVNDPITIEEIREFQNNYNIILPETLSLFYTQIGNGCKMIDGYELKGLYELEFNETKINEEFIFTKFWIWEEEDENNPLFDKVGSGNIELINIGDGQSWNIIITGEGQGQMWFFTEVGIQPCAPKRIFISWFEYWLDGNDNYFEGFIL